MLGYAASSFGGAKESGGRIFPLRRATVDLEVISSLEESRESGSTQWESEITSEGGSSASGQCIVLVLSPSILLLKKAFRSLSSNIIFTVSLSISVAGTATDTRLSTPSVRIENLRSKTRSPQLAALLGLDEGGEGSLSEGGEAFAIGTDVIEGPRALERAFLKLLGEYSEPSGTHPAVSDFVV